MKRFFFTLTAAAVALTPLSLWAQATRVDDDNVRTNQNVRGTDRVLTDAEFLQRAAIDGLVETTLAGMVDDQTDDENLEKYADRIDADHDKANRDLVTLAEQKGIDVPNTLDDRHKNMIDQMDKLEGQAFEQRYLRQQVMAHERAVRLFAAEAEHGQDPEIRDFARKQLPVLRQHLKMAQDFASAGVLPLSGATGSRPGRPPKGRLRPPRRRLLARDRGLRILRKPGARRPDLFRRRALWFLCLEDGGKPILISMRDCFISGSSSLLRVIRLW